jgi:hypothetical protein
VQENSEAGIRPALQYSCEKKKKGVTERIDMEYFLIVLAFGFVGMIIFPKEKYMEVGFFSLIWPLTLFCLAIAVPLSLIMVLGVVVRASVEYLWGICLERFGKVRN